MSSSQHEKDTAASPGVFETMLVPPRKAGAAVATPFGIRGFHYHLERFCHGCNALSMQAFPTEFIQQKITEAIISQSPADYLRLKILASRDGFQSAALPFIPRLYYSSGATLASCIGERPSPTLKLLDTFVSQRSQDFALKNKADEALLCDAAGVVREGAWSNFFWVNAAGKLVTPATNILPGITRRLILEGMRDRVDEQDVSLEHIKTNAREAFITNALHGVVPVKAIDDTSLNTGSITSLASSLLEDS